MDGGWMDRKKDVWLDGSNKIYEKKMDGWKKNIKNMDGWMDRKKRWMVGWIKIYEKKMDGWVEG